MPALSLLDGVHSFARPAAVSRDAKFGLTDLMHLGKLSATLTSMAQRRNDLGAFTSVNSAGVLTMHQRWIIQVLCACMASVSITAAICAIYWFFIMRRNYRRDLVLMLILGDFYKSLWYLIYGIVNFVQGQVRSSNPFCQVTGFMIQTGLAACDLAILFISMHMALQIFPPAHSILGHDGLYRIRRYVFTAWILIPSFGAAMAFVNPHTAYSAQGAFCWLPIRPFWYRLALSWIPRYLVWIYVMYVAVRIYSHVGYEFKVFGEERDRSSSMDMTAQSSVARAGLANSRKYRGKSALAKIANEDDVAPDDISTHPSTRMYSPTESTKSMPFNAARRQSLPTWHTPFGGHSGPDLPIPFISTGQGSRSNPSSRRGSHQVATGIVAEDFMAPPNFDFTRARGSVSTIGSNARSMTAGSLENGLPPIQESRQSMSGESTAPTDAAQSALKLRRRAIQRQLRILFIYPIVYMGLWLLPFISHCMSYSDRFAQHPVFAISALSGFCQTFMGTADVAVFCWREKPWKHIPGSDGTFWGSFCFWRFWKSHDWTEKEFGSPAGSTTGDNAQSQSQTGLLNSFKRWSMSRKGSSPRASTSLHTGLRPGGLKTHMRTFSGGGSDRKLREAEHAHERLALERADFQKNRSSLNERRASAMDSLHRPPTREWFDSELATGESHVDEKGERGQ